MPSSTLHEAKAGLEIAGRVYPVAVVDRSKTGVVRVGVESVILDLVPKTRGPAPGDAGVLSVVTPRGKLLQEPLGVLKDIFVSRDFDANILFDFWFKQE